MELGGIPPLFPHCFDKKIERRKGNKKRKIKRTEAVISYASNMFLPLYYGCWVVSTKHILYGFLNTFYMYGINYSKYDQRLKYPSEGGKRERKERFRNLK